MKRGRYFFIAFLSAAFTFAGLTAFVNPKYSGMRYGYGWHHSGWRGGYYPPYYNYPPPGWDDSSRHPQQPWH